LAPSGRRSFAATLATTGAGRRCTTVLLESQRTRGWPAGMPCRTAMATAAATARSLRSVDTLPTSCARVPGLEGGVESSVSPPLVDAVPEDGRDLGDGRP